MGVEQQMQLMAQQLALLAGNAGSVAPLAAATSIPVATAAAVPAVVAMPAATTPPNDEEAALAHTKYDVKKAFGAIARIDTAGKLELSARQQDRLDQFIRRYVAPGSAVLDVGCGTGVLAKALAAKGYDVTGMDPFDGMLAYLRQRAPEITAVQGRGEAIPFPDNTFDLAYCVAVMHHVADPKDVHDTLKEMVRVTKPTGLFGSSAVAGSASDAMPAAASGKALRRRNARPMAASAPSTAVDGSGTAAASWRVLEVLDPAPPNDARVGAPDEVRL